MIRALILSLLCVTAQAQTAEQAVAADVATTGIGLAVALQRWDAGAQERLFWAICAHERLANPRLICEFTKPT